LLESAKTPMQDLRMLPGGVRALEDDDGKPPRFLLSFILSLDILLLSLFYPFSLSLSLQKCILLLLARDDRRFVMTRVMKNRSTKQSFSSFSLSLSFSLSVSLSRFWRRGCGLRVPSNLLLKQKKRIARCLGFFFT
jgi:hypothetical protein